MLEWIGKPIEWLAVVTCITMYLIVRATEMSFLERILLGLLPAGLAWGLSDLVSDWLGVNEVFTAILIMLFGPGILGAMMTTGKDEDWITALLRGYIKKRLNLEDVKDE